MVHYDASAQTLPPPPALCPKCGSHRTEVVGRSADGTMLTIRCNACGERSQIANPTGSDDLAAELDAMARIARVLSTLDNADSRARVLQWAMTRSSDDGEPERTPQPEPRPEPIRQPPSNDAAGDPSLELDETIDLFAGDAYDARQGCASFMRFVIGGDIRRRLPLGWLRA